MCGIVGIIGDKPAADRIYTALQLLEYRGYDSAGIATLVDGKRDMRKAVGKLSALGSELTTRPLDGTIGIGHTRWATHGVPSVENSHPHTCGSVTVVHNGIIENFQDLRDELIAAGHDFHSETDTEVVAVLANSFVAMGATPADAFRKTLSRLEGAFAFGILFEGTETLYAARRGSPLAIGYGVGENYLGSDAIALAGFTNRVTFLNDGDYAILTREDVKIFDALDNPVDREIKIINSEQLIADKGRHRHFMAKEIHDQPSALSYVLSHYISDDRHAIDFTNAEEIKFKDADRITLIACGTAYLACFVAKYWIEKWARIAVDVEIASEFRYRQPPLSKNHVAMFVSQSGETADTLAALQYANSQNIQTVALVNNEVSSIAREATIALPLKAGVEYSVASTKAFTAQLTVFAVMALKIAQDRGVIDATEVDAKLRELTSLPRLINEAVQLAPEFEKMAHELAKATDVLFLGRGPLYPLALEGALKLKEITYIHAEGYASGELKHGPIALVDEKMPIVVFAPNDSLFDKTISNMQEVAARGGRIFLITDNAGAVHVRGEAEAVVIMPDVSEDMAPILYAVPAQMLAYYTAVAKGTDVDQPRNLAKSVTVE